MSNNNKTNSNYTKNFNSKSIYTYLIFCCVTMNQLVAQDVTHITSDHGIVYESSDATKSTYLHIDTENGRVGVNTIPTEALEVVGKVLIGDGTGDPITIGDYPYGLWVEHGTVSEDLFLVDQTNWADYVFNDDYELMPLSTLKTYINKNKHLPGVIPAKDVAENGYSQHKINTTYLEKIEELVLYTIEQEARIKELANILLEQQKLIEKLSVK